MKKLLIIVLAIILTSCSTYNLSTDYKIKSILTITEAGDTLAVPVRQFKFRILDNRDPFRYQYRQDWNRWNYRSYSIPYVNQSNWNKPNYNVKPNSKPFTPQVVLKPYKPMNAIPVVKPSLKKKN